MQRAFRYRFYPTADQTSLLNRTFGCVRWVYNHAREARSRGWRDQGRSVHYSETSALLGKWKSDKDTAWLNEVSCVPLQQSLRHLDTAYSNFFRDAASARREKRRRRVGYPQRKRRKVSKDSAEFTRSSFRWDSVDLRLAKCEKPLAIVWSRPLPAGVRPSTVTVSRDRAGRWHVSLRVKDETMQPLPDTDGAVGLDLGLDSLVTLSDGRKLANLRHGRRERKRLTRAHRALSRKAKGSSNREKARRRLGRVSVRMADRRRDGLHQLTTEIVRENQVVVIEDLAVKQMQARGGAYKRGLNRSIADAGWGQLRWMLEYKCAWYGRQLVVVDRWFPSSKACADCGLVLAALPLDVRAWVCPGCGAVHDRDINAAQNVLAAGLAVTACGHGVSPLQRGAVVAEAGSSCPRGWGSGGFSRPEDVKADHAGAAAAQTASQRDSPLAPDRTTKEPAAHPTARSKRGD